MALRTLLLLTWRLIAFKYADFASRWTSAPHPARLARIAFDAREFGSRPSASLM